MPCGTSWRDAATRSCTTPSERGVADPYLEAQQLAITLSRDGLDELLSDSELYWLRDRLGALLASAEGRWAFVDTLGTDGLVELTEELKMRWWDGREGGDPSVMDDAAATLGLIGAALATRHHEGGWTEPMDVITRVDPITASFMVIAMDVTAQELAALTEPILDTFAEGNGWLDAATFGDLVMPGDILFPRFAASPEASRELLLRCRDKLDEIFQMSYDKQSVQRMVEGAVAWRPAVTDAGAVLAPTLTYLHEADLRAGYEGFDWTFLGALITPYIDNFTVIGQGEWPWSTDRTPTNVMTFLIGVPGLLTAIVAEQAAKIDDILQSGRPLAPAMFDDISALKALVNQAVERHEIDRRLAEQAYFGLLTNLAGTVVGAVGGAAGEAVGGPAGGVVGGVASEHAWSAFQTWMQEQGYWPPTEAMITSGEATLTDYREMAMTHAAVVQYLIGRGVPVASLPRPTTPVDPNDPRTGTSCSSGRYLSDVRTWLDDSHPGVDSSIKADVSAIVDGLLSPGASQILCSSAADR